MGPGRPIKSQRQMSEAAVSLVYLLANFHRLFKKAKLSNLISFYHGGHGLERGPGKWTEGEQSNVHCVCKNAALCMQIVVVKYWFVNTCVIKRNMHACMGPFFFLLAWFYIIMTCVHNATPNLSWLATMRAFQENYVHLQHTTLIFCTWFLATATGKCTHKVASAESQLFLMSVLCHMFLR